MMCSDISQMTIQEVLDLKAACQIEAKEADSLRERVRFLDKELFARNELLNEKRAEVVNLKQQNELLTQKLDTLFWCLRVLRAV